MNPGRRLFVSDIDGSLVTPAKVLTPATIQAVAELRAADGPFSVRTAAWPRLWPRWG